MNAKRFPPVIVISGIDTGVGKTVATGLLARWFKDSGLSVITMKMVQTGCSGISEDIIEHRKLSGMEMIEEDALGITCPYVLEVPCSPHLAARLEGVAINLGNIRESVEELKQHYDYVLLEGAGGLQVPLTDETTILDFVQDNGWPVVLVSSPRLGSINHTLGSLELLKTRQISIQGIIYNMSGSDRVDGRIVEDSRELFRRRLDKFGLSGRICDIPNVSCTASYCVDFSALFTHLKRETDEF